MSVRRKNIQNCLRFIQLGHKLEQWEISDMQIKCFEKHSELFAIRTTTTQITNNKLEQWEIFVLDKSDQISF